MIFDDEAIEIAANLLYNEEINWKESLRLTNKVLNSALARMKARGSDPCADVSRKKSIEPYHIERLVKHLQYCIDNFYATETMPEFNWSEWKDILAALIRALEDEK